MHSDRTGPIGTGPVRSAVSAVATQVGWRWLLLGAAGAALLATVSPPLLTAFDGPAVSWWYRLAIPGGSSNTLAAYGGMGAVIASWLAVGRRLRGGWGSPRVLWLPLVAWSAPLVLGPPLFSRDVYSYLSQATLTELHLSPYRHAAAALVGTPGHTVLSAVAPAWRHTLSPYGPLFLWLGAALVRLVGHGVIAGVLVMRLPALIGVALMAVFAPRLASRYGADPGRAMWLGVLSPLVLFQLVAAGHNDALMIGLMVAGLALASADHHLAGVALSAVAAMVKLPALAGCAAITVAYARSRPGGRSASRSIAASLVVSGAVITGVSGFSGLGFGWMSPTVLLTPARGSIEVTPATAIGDAAAGLVHLLGGTLSAHVAVTAVWVAALVAAGAFAGLVVVRCRTETLAAAVAAVLLAAVLAAPALWPWYLTWGFTLLAVLPGVQWSRSVLAATVAACLVIAPTGQINVPAPDGPYVAAAWAAIAAVVVRRRLRIPDDRPAPALATPHPGGGAPVVASGVE